MGDRCYLSISWRKDDTTKLAAALVKEGLLGKGDPIQRAFSDGIDQDGEMMVGSEAEANYGWYTQLQEIAKAGIVFAGWNDDGGEYGASEWCAWKGAYYETPSGHDCGPIVCVQEDGTIDRHQLAQVHRYQKAVRKSLAYIKCKKPTKKR